MAQNFRRAKAVTIAIVDQYRPDHFGYILTAVAALYIPFCPNILGNGDNVRFAEFDGFR